MIKILIYLKIFLGHRIKTKINFHHILIKVKKIKNYLKVNFFTINKIKTKSLVNKIIKKFLLMNFSYYKIQSKAVYLKFSFKINLCKLKLIK